MDIKEAIEKRRSARNYNNKNISWELLDEILDAGRYAPSAGNIQTWKVIIVTGAKDKQKIALCCLNQEWINKASVALILCSNLSILKKHYEKEAERYSRLNIGAVAQNIMLRATSLGISNCWVDTFESKSLRRHFKIPEEIIPEVIITLGFSDEKLEVPRKVELEKLVYYGKWDNTLRDEKVLPIIIREAKAKVSEAIDKAKKENFKEKIKRVFRKK
ncbi:MAG: nitroreductase family protein [Candidatus Woesearchaeota archaeon]|nr:MAG: nitroreductase family protein [Candidatus Woesearchaeota archaeon]